MSKSKQEFRRIKQKMISMGNPLHGAVALFNCESEGTILKHSNALCNENFFRSAVVGRCFPATVAEMGSCGNLPHFDDLRKTLGWYVLGLCAKSKEIQEYLSLREQFDYAYLGGQYDQCLGCIKIVTWYWDSSQKQAVSVTVTNCIGFKYLCRSPEEARLPSVSWP